MKNTQFAINPLRQSLVTRVSLKPDIELDKSSTEVKLKHFRDVYFDSPDFPNNIVKLYSKTVGDANTSDSDLTKFTTKLLKNEGLARAYTSLMFRYTPTESSEPIYPGGVAVKGKTLSGETFLIPSMDTYKTNGMWVTKADWREIMRIIFNITKIIFNLTMVGIVFLRPFMPEWAKLRAIWIGQTVIYYQLLVYSGLIPGVFGYAIDMGHEGMLESSRRYFFGYAIPHIETDSDFTVYKFV